MSSFLPADPKGTTDQIFPEVSSFLSADPKGTQGDQLRCRCLLEEGTGGLNSCLQTKILFKTNFLHSYTIGLAPASLRSKERWPFPTSSFKAPSHSLTTGKTKPVTTNKVRFASSSDTNCFCAQDNSTMPKMSFIASCVSSWTPQTTSKPLSPASF